MSRFDDRLTKELERAARPPEPADVFDEIDRRRARRVTVRRLQTAMLATVVFAGSIGGVLVLNRAFRGEGSITPVAPLVQNGLIVVSFGDDGGTHLYLQNPDDPTWDPRDHQLTDPGPNRDGVVHLDANPAVSPDGRTVAFERKELSPKDPTAESVWTIGIDGTGLHRVSDPSVPAHQPAWSPDGSKIAYVSSVIDGTVLTVANADGSDAHPLDPTPEVGDPNASDPAWSPDGSRIAVAIRQGSDGSSIETIDVETGERTLVSPALWDVGSPSWSPDGRRLTFAHGGGVVVLTLDGGDVFELTTTHTAEEAQSADLEYRDSQPTWSPDGRWIAFERFFSPSEFFVYAIRPDGTDLHRIGLGGDPAWSVTQPEATPTDTSSPAEETPGRDIGLGFNVCRLESLDGIDFFGEGTDGTAWVATRLTEDGSCPNPDQGDNIVAVDVDGDGSAESWAGPLGPCLVCSPYDTTDLNADGVLELVVTLQSSAWAEYRLFSLQPVPGNGPPEIRQVTVAEPGLPPNFRAGEPVALFAGGDAGVGEYIRCEGYPAQPVLISTESVSVVDGPKSSEVDVVRLAFRADGTIEVIGSDSYTDPGTTDPPSYAFTGRACGVDFWPYT